MWDAPLALMYGLINPSIEIAGLQIPPTVVTLAGLQIPPTVVTLAGLQIPPTRSAARQSRLEISPTSDNK